MTYDDNPFAEFEEDYRRDIAITSETDEEGARPFAPIEAYKDEVGRLPEPHGAAETSAGKRDLKVKHFDEDVEAILEDSYLIEDILPKEGLGVAYGKPGCGKTFIALDLALAVAGAQEDWRGQYVEQGAVLYFGMEGGRLFQNRIAAYNREKGRAPWFYRSGQNLDLKSNDSDANAIVTEAQKIGEQGPPVKLIVVDTLNRAMAGGNENSPEDMGSFISICESIRKELGCFLLIIHHCGKDETNGLRGHSSLIGAVDTELSLKRNGTVRTMAVSKQRDGRDDGIVFGYELRQVELGRSPRGKMITSAVVEASDRELAETDKRHKLGSVQKMALEAMQQYIDDHGEPNPPGTGWPEPSARRVVPIEGFLNFFKCKLPNQKADDRRRQANRTFQDMVDKGIFQTNQRKAWIV